MLPLIHWSDLFIRQEVVWDPKDMEDGAGDGASSSHRFLHLSCFFSSNPKHTEKPCALGFSVRVGLKHTLRCVIWVKSWKLEALIWAGSGVNAQNLNRVYCCSSCTTKTTNSNKKNDNYGPTQWQQQQQLKGKLTKGVLFLSSHRFQCSSPRIISRSSSSTSSPFFRFLFSFFSFGPTQVSLFFSVDIFKSIETLQPSLLTHILCYVMQVSNAIFFLPVVKPTLA